MNTLQSNTLPVSASSEGPDRSSRLELLRRSIKIAMDAAYGIPETNPAEVTDVLGGLVREKLLSAEDSYRLRDQLIDRMAFEKLIDRQIDRALSRRIRVIN